MCEQTQLRLCLVKTNISALCCSGRPSSVWVLKGWHLLLDQVVKIDKFPSAVQELSCRPKASCSSTTCSDEKRLPLPKVLYICAQTRTTTAIYSLLPGERREIFPGTLEEKPPFSAGGWGCCGSWDWIAVQKLASCPAETFLHLNM